MSLEPLERSSRNFVCRSPVAVARSSSGGVALRYVLPVIWMTSRLAVIGATPKGGGWHVLRRRWMTRRYRAAVWCLNACSNCISALHLYSVIIDEHFWWHFRYESYLSLKSPRPACTVAPLLLLRPGRGAQYCDQLVCLFVCLSLCLSVREHISGTAWPIFTKFVM